MKLSHRFFLLFTIIALLTSGCYFWEEVEPSQVAVLLVDNRLKGNDPITGCVGAGVYSDSAYRADIIKIDVSTLTFEVADPEVATSDNQLVGVKITLQARRKGDCESSLSFLSNWNHLLNNDVLIQTIDATAREGIKNGTRIFTLEELLDDRNELANAIFTQLSEDAAKYNVEIVNVTIENVDIDDAYAQILNDTAALNAKVDYAERRQTLVEQEAETNLFELQQQQAVLAEQLQIEKANTAISVEIAEREGKVIAAKNEVYSLNAEAYELERLRLLQNIIGPGTVYFIPEGTDLTTIFGLDGSTAFPLPNSTQ